MVTILFGPRPVGLAQLPFVAELAAHLDVFLNDGVQFADILGSISL